MPALTEDEALALTREQILQIKIPEQLFLPEHDKLKHTARKLYSKWHHLSSEDRANTDAFVHVQALVEEGQRRLQEGMWGSIKVLRYEGKNSEISMRYVKEGLNNGISTRYEGETSTVLYFLEESSKDIADLWVDSQLLIVRSLKKLPEPRSTDIQLQFTEQFSTTPKLYETKTGLLVKSVRPPGFINLADIIEAKGPLTIKQIAWVTSRLCNLTCLMQVSGVPNIDISLESVYVNPTTHAVILMSGWQYANSFERKALAAPARTLQVCPTLGKTKIPTIQHCISLVKRTCLEALGDPTGMSLRQKKAVPEPVLNWYLSPAERSAFDSFKAWTKARDVAFPREFIKWDLTFRGVYPQL